MTILKHVFGSILAALAVCFLLTTLVPALTASAAIAEQITFYGTLQNSSGTNLDGTYDMVFRFYDAASGGTLLDTSTHTAGNGNAVTVSSGEFSVRLGSGAGNALDGVDFNSATIFVGLSIEGDPEMTPRERLTAAPYAFNADAVDGIDGASLVQQGATATFTAATSSDLAITNNFIISGTLTDSLSSVGTTGYVLQTTGAGVEWVATSTLGLGGGGSLLFTDGGDTTYLTALTDAFAIGTTSSSSALLNVWGDLRVGTGTTPLLFVDTNDDWIGVRTVSKSVTGQTTERLTIAGGGIIANEPTDPQIVSGVDTDGSAIGITVVGRYAYVADRFNGLEIIDVSDPTNPTIVGGVDTAGAAEGVAVVGRYAYVADDTNGLEIIDVSDPTSPTIVGGVNTAGAANNITVAGRYAYVADDTNGLEIIDISDPTSPTIVGGVNTDGAAYSVVVAGPLRLRS